MSTTSRLSDMPLPDHAKTVGELLAAMRALRHWAAVTYRELESRAQAAGERLPRSTIPSLMASNRLPRESTIAAFVKACIGEEAEVERWTAARRRVASLRIPHPTLAEQVEEWLDRNARDSPRPQTRTYTEGRLAQAVATHSGDRWVGLHRRAKTRRGIRRLLRLGSAAQP